MNVQNVQYRKCLPALLFAFFSVQPALAADVVVSGNTSMVTTNGGQTGTTGCVQGNGATASTTRTVGEIEKIAFNGAYRVSITTGEEKSFVIRGDENIIGLIAAEMDGDTLRVYPKQSICPQKELEIDIVTGTLNYLSAMGAVRVNINGLEEDALKIVVNGSSTVSASGTARSLTASIGGSGELQANDLQSANAALSITGVGEAQVHVSGRLSATITGVGNIYYSGNPERVERNITGVGSIIAR